MIASLKYHFGKLDVYEKYVLAVINEGEHVVPAYNTYLVNIAEKYFNNKNFAYITHRVNSYSVDPSIYIETSKIKNLVCFSVVSKNKINLSNAQVEELFLNKPFKAFSNLAEAIKWSEAFI